MRTLTKLTLFIILSLLLGSCSSKRNPASSGDDNVVDESAGIRQFILGLGYDPDDLLDVQGKGGTQAVATQIGNTTVDSTETNDALPSRTICTKTNFNLEKNFDKLVLLRPLGSVVWPGALVYGNDGLADGVPEPITLARAPITFSIDLPGAISQTVSNPTYSSVKGAMDDALDAWFDTHNTNPANQTSAVTISYSAQQSALQVGLNVEWASGDASAAFSTTSEGEKLIITASYQQAYYTVSIDTPEDPEDVFASSVTLEQVKNEISADAPPAYIESVTYGRMLIFRMETTTSTTSTDAEAALSYGIGKTTVSGDLKTRYDNILSQSQITTFALGGNATLATRLITTGYQGLQDAIAEGAKYDKDNPGYLMGYVVKYLKDNRIAKLGYSTNYTATECRTIKKQKFQIKPTSATAQYDCDGGGAGEIQIKLWVEGPDNTTQKVIPTAGEWWEDELDETAPQPQHRFGSSEYNPVFVEVWPYDRFTVKGHVREDDSDIFGESYEDLETEMITHLAEINNFGAGGEHLLRFGSVDRLCLIEVRYRIEKQ